jgi:tetratricopeptide (TPR) repeat protein
VSVGPDEVEAYWEQAGAAIRRGDRDRAAALLRTGREAADALAAGNSAMLRLYVGMSMQLAELEAQAERWDAAVNVLAESRARCHALGAPAGELWADINLLSVHLAHGDLEVASRYAATVVPLFAAVDAQDEQVIAPPDREQVHQLLCNLAERLYYDPEDYEAARAAAAAAVQLLPDAPLGQYLLGLALNGLGRHQEAVPTWERAVALAPNLPFMHVNLAASLGSIGKIEEAVAAMGRALELAPDNVRYWYARGQWNGQLGRHEAAVADYDRVLELAGEAPYEPQPGTQPKSRAAYERDLPLADLADFAALSRLQSLQALGRNETAIQAAQQLIARRDDVTAQSARVFLGGLYESLGRRHEAIEMFTQVLAEDDSQSMAHERRAGLYLAEGMVNEAAEDLAALADEEEDAQTAIPLLLELLDRAPDHAAARKALGHAYLATWQPGKAFPALTSALAALPDDWELRYWRALARITLGGDLSAALADTEASDAEARDDEARDDEARDGEATDAVEAAWNRSFSRQRITDAIDDLAEAAARTADPRPRTALRWLVERAGADIDLLGWLYLETAAPESRVLEVLPELAALQRLSSAAVLSEGRRWQEAVDELAVGRAQLAETGLPILAAQADLLLADNYLRLYEIQRTLDHLDAADAALPLLGVPLDESGRSQSRELQERRKQQGIPTYSIDLDHFQLVSLAMTRMQTGIQQLRTQALARTGDPARALKGFDQAGGVQQLLEDLNKGRMSFQAALSMGTVLRDAQRFDDALTVGNQLQERADTDRLRLAVHNFMATVLEVTGDLDGAAEHSGAALDIARQEGAADEVAVVVGNLAMIHLLRNQPRQALELVDANQPPPDAQQPIRFAHHAVRGEALMDLDDYAGAQRELTAALAIQEEIRGRLRVYQDRMTWHARQLHVLERAVYAAALNLDWSTALELVERSKARAFVDQLAAGHVPSNVEPRGLLEVLDRVQARQRLLRRLSAAGRRGYVDYELLRQLESLGVGADLVEEGEDGVTRLAAERLANELSGEEARVQRLEAEIENARLAAVESIVGTILSPDELRSLLVGSDAHRQA